VCCFLHINDFLNGLLVAYMNITVTWWLLILDHVAMCLDLCDANELCFVFVQLCCDIFDKNRFLLDFLA
jgi:hypothetical protein